MIKGLLKAFMILFVAIAFAGFAIAEEAKEAKPEAAPAAEKEKPAPKAKVKSVTGEVIAVDATAKTITLKSKIKGEVTVNVTDTTKIKAGKEDKTLADIKAGDKIRVSGKEAEGKIEAKSVRILPAKAKEKAKPAEEKPAK